MNKRTVEKKYKNKFRRVFAMALSYTLGAKIPPSRISFEVIEEAGGPKLIGHYHNYEIKVKLPGEKEA